MDNNSFNATLRMVDYHVNLLEILHGKPAMATVTLFSGGFYTGAPQTHDHSRLLGMKPQAQGAGAAPLLLHFHPAREGFNLVIKTPGEYYNRPIGESWLDIIGAQDSNTDDATVFNLVNPQNRPITRKDISAPHIPVSLVTKNNKYIGGSRVRGSSYRYLAETSEKSKITFVLSIL